ncbi:hypothetical protein D3C78_1675390 [compost metagenome]
MAGTGVAAEVVVDAEHFQLAEGGFQHVVGNGGGRGDQGDAAGDGGPGVGGFGGHGVGFRSGRLYVLGVDIPVGTSCQSETPARPSLAGRSLAQRMRCEPQLTPSL